MFTRIKQNQKFAAKMWKSKFAQTPAINSPYWTIHRYVTGNVCNSQLVNKVGCFRVFVVFFFLLISQIGKRIPNPYMGQEYPFFFFLSWEFLILVFFQTWELNVPIFSLTWIFHIPKIPQDGILVSQTLSGMGF